MIATPADAHLIKELRQLVERVPQGRLITFGALSLHLKTSPRHVATVLHALADGPDHTVPWQRVVADGGAVGRHPRRIEQIQRLKAEGIAVSDGGFVQDFARVVIANITGPMPPAAVVASVPLSRSRGMKDRPV